MASLAIARGHGERLEWWLLSRRAELARQIMAARALWPLSSMSSGSWHRPQRKARRAIDGGASHVLAVAGPCARGRVDNTLTLASESAAGWLAAGWLAAGWL